MARGKLPPIYTLNTLESMIEYTLISSILDRICDMTTKPWECPRDKHSVTSPVPFVGNQNMGNKMEKNNCQNR
jgi:hypothetical protein